MPRPNRALTALKVRLDEMGLLAELAEICLGHHVTVDRLLEGSRTRNVVIARRHACAHLRTVHKMSYPEIGAALGLDHTTAIYAVREWERANLKAANG